MSVAICPPPVSGPIAGVMLSPDGREDESRAKSRGTEIRLSRTRMPAGVMSVKRCLLSALLSWLFVRTL